MNNYIFQITAFIRQEIEEKPCRKRKMRNNDLCSSQELTARKKNQFIDIEADCTDTDGSEVTELLRCF